MTTLKIHHLLLLLFFIGLNPLKNTAQALKIQHDLTVAKDGRGDRGAITPKPFLLIAR